MSVSIRSRRVAGVTGVVVLALLLTAAPAFAAGHIQSRFHVPAVDDPYDAQSDEHVFVDGSTVCFLCTDSSFAGDTHDGYRWTIGDPALTAFAPAADAEDVDNGIAVYRSGGEGSPFVIRATNGILDVVVCTGSPGHIPASPRISGTRVVWEDWNATGTKCDIRGATIDPVTLAPASTFAVCTAAGKQTKPSIDGDIVAWQDHRSGQWDIWARDLGNGTSKAICRVARGQALPSVGGGWIAWVDFRSHANGADIYAREWSGTATRAVCRAPKAQKEVAVGNGFIVWTDWRDSASGADEPPNTSVRGYDIVSKRSFTIGDGPGMQHEPSIDGATVAWLTSTDTHMGEPWWAGISGAVLQQ
jgi:beta propeller repeat protein